MSAIDDAVKRLLQAIGKSSSPLKKDKPKGTFQVKGNMRDDRTFSQLAEQRFSGLRANDLWLRFEIWILGKLNETLSYGEFFKDPDSLNRLYAKTFGIDITFSEGAMRDIAKLKERKILLDDPDIQRALDARDSILTQNKKRN